MGGWHRRAVTCGTAEPRADAVGVLCGASIRLLRVSGSLLDSRGLIAPTCLNNRAPVKLFVLDGNAFYSNPIRTRPRPREAVLAVWPFHRFGFMAFQGRSVPSCLRRRLAIGNWQSAIPSCPSAFVPFVLLNFGVSTFRRFCVFAGATL